RPMEKAWGIVDDKSEIVEGTGLGAAPARVARGVTGVARAWIGFDGVCEVKVPACTLSVSPTFTMERTRTQPKSRTLAQRPWTFSRAPAAGVSNSTREASVKSRPSF